MPRKERLVLTMVEEVTKKNRAKKQKALQRVTESLVRSEDLPEIKKLEIAFENYHGFIFSFCHDSKTVV